MAALNNIMDVGNTSKKSVFKFFQCATGPLPNKDAKRPIPYSRPGNGTDEGVCGYIKTVARCRRFNMTF